MRTLVPLLSLVLSLPACGGGGGGSDDPPPSPDAPTGCQPDFDGRSCGLDPVCGTVCGTCSDGTCSAAGVCEPDSCTPRTCAQAGAECGLVDDGCGNTLECGGCGANETCGAQQVNQCGQGTCTPRTCAEAGAECGTIDNGCGEALTCGTCSGGATCGTGGQPNVCAAPPSQWQQVATGNYHTCAIKQDGSLWCWGRNNLGQLGLGATGGTMTTPQRVGTSFGWTEVATGGFHTCGINYNHLYCWGWNDSYQLGDGTTNAATTPRLIESDREWRDVVAGYTTTCASDNERYCWGNTIYNQLSEELGDVTSPTSVGSVYTVVALGGGHACYLREGVLGPYIVCGGLDTSGQLGDGSIQPSSPPTDVGLDTEWSDVFAGGSHTCGFAYTGLLYCWGSNEYGQLGNLGAAESLPSVVDGLSDWREMGLGDAHTCGVKENGNLYCWGINDGGQIGDGSMTNRYEPVLIGSGFASVSGGYAHTCALDTDQQLWCWGHNAYGQLGTGGGSSSVPVRIP